MDLRGRGYCEEESKEIEEKGVVGTYEVCGR